MESYAGTILNERYRVEQLLGEGGMGAVYLGRHMVIGKRVAIKFLHTLCARNEMLVKRFLREAQITAEIEHSNIVDVLDFGISPQGEPYLVMEYLEGESLAALLERTGPLGSEAAAAIMIPVLRALEAAHDKEVVHRDLKPENIFVIPNQGDIPTLKVIDFGVSKLKDGEDEKLTQTGTILGTPAYMSPEQARGAADLDHRADLYAMGVIFYEMLTGALPFEGKTYHALLLKVLTEPPRPATDIISDLSGASLAIIDRALSKDPAQRYQSAAEMIEALEALTNLEQRVGRLTQIAYGATLHCIGGDLGETLAPSSESLSRKLIDEMVSDRSPVRPPRVGPRIIERGRKLAKDGYRWSRLNQRRTATVALASIFALALLATALSGSEDLVTGEPEVLITVLGIPPEATILYNDEEMEQNPFKVKRRKVVALVKVHADGYEPFKLWIVPTEDKTISAELTPDGKRDPPAAEPDSEVGSAEDTDVRKKGRKSSGGPRSFFRRLKNKITN